VFQKAISTPSTPRPLNITGREHMIIAVKSVHKVIRTTAPFLFSVVLIQVILGTLMGSYYEALHEFHEHYAPIVLIALVFTHATFGFLSMFARSQRRDSHGTQIVVVLAMAIFLVFLVIRLAL